MRDSTPTVYDVAEVAGVSTASVSRYFRSPEKVSEQTRQVIQGAVEQLGYVPSGVARGLAERRTGLVGLYSFSGHEPDELELPGDEGAGRVNVVSDDRRHPRLYPLFADEVLRGVELECTLRRLPLAVGWKDGEDGGVALDDIARLSDGVILLPSTVSESGLRHLARSKPVVVVSQRPPPGTTASSVVVDNEAGMRSLVGHLVEAHDRTRFWYAGPIEGPEHEARFHGFVQELRERGLEPPVTTILDTGTRLGSYQAMARILATVRDPRAEVAPAIVCSSDQTALGVLSALADSAVRVPEDTLVTGFDGIDAGRFSDPGLTTVRQPMDWLGRVAVSLLRELIDSPGSAGRDVVLPVTLVLRRSCGCES